MPRIIKRILPRSRKLSLKQFNPGDILEIRKLEVKDNENNKNEN